MIASRYQSHLSFIAREITQRNFKKCRDSLRFKRIWTRNRYISFSTFNRSHVPLSSPSSFLFSSNSHQRANVYIKSRFMAHLVWITVHTFYGSGSQDDILRSSTDRYAMVVYIQKFMYSSPSNASSASHHHDHHRHHHRATRKISSMESFGNYYHFDYISWQLCTRREIEYFERVVIFLQHLKRKMSIYKRMRNWLSKWRGTWLFLWWFLSMRLKLSQGRYNCSIYVRFLLIKWISFV